MEKNNISREFIFELSIIQNHAVEVIFWPRSESHKLFGDRIVIKMLENDLETEIFKKNYFSNPPINTYGKIKAEVLDKESLSQVQINDLMNIGFDTGDIYEIRHL